MLARDDHEPVGPAIPLPDEEERLDSLAGFAPDALRDDPELDAIARFAAELCDAPVGLVTVVARDEQLFLGRHGTSQDGTPRPTSFCSVAIGGREALIVPDTRADARFAGFPVVTGEPHVRFYAGFPLISFGGSPLGTLCVLDMAPRPGGLDALQYQGLHVLRDAALRRLEARREELLTEGERALIEQRDRAFADAIPALAFTARADGAFDYVNRPWRDYIGATSEALPEPGFPHVHPEDRDQLAALWREASGGSKPFEAEFRWRRHDGVYRWMLGRANPVFSSSGAVLRWFGILIDIDETYRQLEARDLLAGEMSHRIKNIFAIINGLITLRSQGRKELADFTFELTQTIAALGRAHDYVRPQADQTGDRLKQMLSELLAPYALHGGERIEIAGIDAPIGARAATPLALVMHELATNSVKYGALAQADGRIEVTIEQPDDTDRVAIVWNESLAGGTGPAEAAIEPPREGFGTRLVRLSIESQLGGKVERRMTADGLRVRLTLPRSKLAA